MVSDEVSLSKRITFILIIIIGSALLPIAIVEGGGRAYIHFMYGIPGKSYGLWRYDAELGAQHAENGYNLHAETNNHGFRNKCAGTQTDRQLSNNRGWRINNVLLLSFQR